MIVTAPITQATAEIRFLEAAGGDFEHRRPGRPAGVPFVRLQHFRAGGDVGAGW
jgi:hypothetical protein